MSLDRREFMRAAGLAAVGAALGEKAMVSGQAVATQPTAVRKLGGGPIVIASANGYKPDRALNPVVEAMKRLQMGGDPADAVVEGVKIVEDDPTDHSVGLGGLPNEEGVVELDASVMHGPTHKAGAVAALRNIKNPASVALLVMRRTDHVLLVGEGALKFARAHGFEEMNLLTPESRAMWLKWKETSSNTDNWLHPEADKEAARLMGEEGPGFTWGTINCQALTASGDLAGTTSTSGLSWKLSGRVGDSPILGAGLFVDNEVGAAGSTGRGEANLLNCSSFFIVEQMRAGKSPEEACFAALRRVAERCEKRLRNENGEPNFGLTFYALRKDGVFGGANMHGPTNMAVCDAQGPRHVTLPPLFP